MDAVVVGILVTGNDLVDGGPGTDRMAFNGSNIGELIDVTDNAGRVRVTRNIGTITLELDNTETLDVPPSVAPTRSPSTTSPAPT